MDATSLLNAIRSAYSEIGRLEHAASDFADDPFVELNLHSLRAHAQSLEEELTNSDDRQVEIAKYRMVRHFGTNFSVGSVSSSLAAFQAAFSQMFDALKVGVKERARIGIESLENSQLDFGWSFSGSLGIALTIPTSRDMLQNDYDIVIDHLFRAMDIENQQDVRDISKIIGTPSIRKIYNWCQVNANNGLDVDFNWVSSTRGLRGRYFDIAKFNSLINTVSATSDVKKETIVSSGVLEGLDLTSRSFRVLTSSGSEIRGSLASGFDAALEYTVNRRYRFEIIHESVFRYDTLKTSDKYTLNSLNAPD